MAGAVEERPKPEAGKKGKKHRVGIRIDMTPMVDVAFLLLIFFMVTTVFRLPLAMEVNLPPPDQKVEVKESGVTTLFIDKDNSMYYRDGTWPITPVSWQELPMVLQGTIGLNKEALTYGLRALRIAPSIAALSQEGASDGSIRLDGKIIRSPAARRRDRAG